MSRSPPRRGGGSSQGEEDPFFSYSDAAHVNEHRNMYHHQQQQHHSHNHHVVAPNSFPRNPPHISYGGRYPDSHSYHMHANCDNSYSNPTHRSNDDDVRVYPPQQHQYGASSPQQHQYGASSPQQHQYGASSPQQQQQRHQQHSVEGSYRQDRYQHAPPSSSVSPYDPKFHKAATEVIQALASCVAAGQCAATASPQRSPSPGGSASYAKVDPNARYCNLCTTPYFIQIAKDHFEGKRHRQHLIRLLHSGDVAELTNQAELARRAGCVVTEDLYGSAAYQREGSAGRSRSPSNNNKMTMSSSPPSSHMRVDAQELLRLAGEAPVAELREMLTSLAKLAVQLRAGTGSSSSSGDVFTDGGARRPGGSIGVETRISDGKGGTIGLVDPSRRYCEHCETEYTIQNALTHFEGKRHRQHVLRMLHSQDWEALKIQAQLARQAGIVITEDLYGPFAAREPSRSPPHRPSARHYEAWCANETNSGGGFDFHHQSASSASSGWNKEDDHWHHQQQRDGDGYSPPSSSVSRGRGGTDGRGGYGGIQPPGARLRIAAESMFSTTAPHHHHATAYTPPRTSQRQF